MVLQRGECNPLRSVAASLNVTHYNAWCCSWVPPPNITDLFTDVDRDSRRSRSRSRSRSRERDRRRSRSRSRSRERDRRSKTSSRCASDRSTRCCCSSRTHCTHAAAAQAHRLWSVGLQCAAVGFVQSVYANSAAQRSAETLLLRTDSLLRSYRCHSVCRLTGLMRWSRRSGAQCHGAATTPGRIGPQWQLLQRSQQ